MGFSDIGSYGGEIETPNLDALARGGVRYSDFYNASRCCPTRASLMTGLHPHLTGIGHMTNPPGTQKHDYGEEFPNYRGFLNRECVTLAELLGSAGYSSYLAGKWHLGGAHKSLWPLQRGFDRFYGCVAGSTRFFSPDTDQREGRGFTPVIKRSPKLPAPQIGPTTPPMPSLTMPYDLSKKGIRKSPSFCIFPTLPRTGLIRHMRRISTSIGEST